MLQLSSASQSAEVAVKAPVVSRRRQRVIESDNEEEEDDSSCETESEEDEETEEDRAFINDGRVEKVEQDTAAIDAKNIIPCDETGGRPKRQRKAPTRWEHPDADTVMRKFCDKWKVTDEDIEEIMKEEEPAEQVEDDDDSSFHTEDELDEIDSAEPENEEEEEEEAESEDFDSVSSEEEEDD